MPPNDQKKSLEQINTAFVASTPEQQAALAKVNAAFQPITSADFTPATSPSFTTPSTQPSPTTQNVEDFAPKPLEATLQETEISKMIKDIQGIDVSGQTAFRAGEEQRLGVETLQKEEADLFARLKSEQAEFTNIQNERPLIESRIQEEFAGRGA